MKKGIAYVIAAVVLMALQTTVFKRLNIFGASPDLMFALMVCAALAGGSFMGGGAGLFAGLLTDIMGFGAFGVHSVLYMYIGIAIGFSSRNFYRIRNIVAVSITFAASLVFEILYFFFGFYIWGNGGMLFSLASVIIPESLYTAALSIPVLILVTALNKSFTTKEA